MLTIAIPHWLIFAGLATGLFSAGFLAGLIWHALCDRNAIADAFGRW